MVTRLCAFANSKAPRYGHRLVFEAKLPSRLAVTVRKSAMDTVRGLAVAGTVYAHVYA